MKSICKRTVSILLCAALLLGLAACGAAESDVRLAKSTVRDDVLDYIQETVGSDVELTECDQEREELSKKEIEVTCEVEFTGDASGEGTFLLTYILEDDEWELDDCVAERLDVATGAASSAEIDVFEPEAAAEEPPVAEGPVAAPDGGNVSPAEVSESYGTVEYPIDDLDIAVMYPEALEGYLSEGLALSESETGVTIDYRVMKDSTAEEQYNLCIVSGDYPEIFLCFYPTYKESQSIGLTTAFDDDVLIDPSEYLKEYAPDFMKLCADEDGQLPGDFYTDGIMTCFPAVDAEGNKIGGAYDTYRVGMYISTACDNIPAAVQWCNWWYTEQAAEYSWVPLGRSDVSASELAGVLSVLD